MDKLKTFIFIGQSGCGKGTQIELLEKHLQTTDPGTPILRIKTGDSFRSFVTGDSYSSQLSKKVMETGSRQADFLAVWLWSDLLISKMTGHEHLIFDGSPRSLSEAKMLETALSFYNREEVYVIHLNIPQDVARERLFKRGRQDDKSTGEVETRLSWFEKDVVPAVEFYRNHDKVTFIDLDGTPSIEEINEDLLNKLSDKTQN